MDDCLLKVCEVAKILSTSPKIAREILSKNGLQAINLGRGRCRGLRYLKSAVLEVLRKVNIDTQNSHTHNMQKVKKSKIASMNARELLEFVKK